MEMLYVCPRHAIRIKKDTRLHEDVQDFIPKHDISLERPVTKLLDDHFPRQHYTDPEYPG